MMLDELMRGHCNKPEAGSPMEGYYMNQKNAVKVVDFANAPPRSVWVVSSPTGPDFVAIARESAMEHAAVCAGDFPELGPYRVCEYIAKDIVGAEFNEEIERLGDVISRQHLLGDQLISDGIEMTTQQPTREQVVQWARDSGLVSTGYVYDESDEAEWIDIERFARICIEAALVTDGIAQLHDDMIYNKCADLDAVIAEKEFQRQELFRGLQRQGESAQAEINGLRATIAEQAAEIEQLKALSVTNILVDIVPGDGSGHEIYASSLKDVQSLITRLSEKADDYDLVTVPLRQQLAAAQEDNALLKGHEIEWLNHLREVSDQLAAAQLRNEQLREESFIAGFICAGG